MVDPVSIVCCGRYNLDEVLTGITRAIDLAGGIEPLKKKGTKLLLKLNMLAGSPAERAVTTHPVFFEAALLFFQKQGFTVYAGDAPAIESTAGAGKRNGLLKIAQSHGAEWVDFADTVDMPNPDGMLVKKFTVARIFSEVDAVVSMPKLKTHSQMYYTGAMKNMFGAVHGLEKSRFHVRFPDRDNFAKMIVDLCALLKPDLSLMDGIVAMEGNGPQNGTPFNMNLILASYDPLALDTIACRTIGYDPEKIPVLRHAYARGIWISSPDKAVTTGEILASVTRPEFKKIKIVKEIAVARDKVPECIYNAVRNLIVPRPFFGKKCILCRRCVEICQAGALTIKEQRGKQKIVPDYDKCIRCYCCHEICPADAITLSRGILR